MQIKHSHNTMRKAKYEYYKHEKDSSVRNPKKMWNTLKQVLPVKSTCIPNSTEITADEFYDLFSSVSERLTSNFGDLIIPSVTYFSPLNIFYLSVINVHCDLQEHDPHLYVLDFESKLLGLSALLIAPLFTHITFHFYLKLYHLIVNLLTLPPFTRVKVNVLIQTTTDPFLLYYQ